MLRVLSCFDRVISAQEVDTARLSRRSRFLAALVGAGLLAALFVATQLRADPRGLGTHEQLGLPPCSFIIWTGKRCPACGMTTAWALMAHGHVVQALRTHTTGALLAVLALPVGLAAAAMAIGGRRLAWQPGDVLVAATSVLLAGAVLAEWIVRLANG
jgi:uncharacterized protein DUF2752